MKAPIRLKPISLVVAAAVLILAVGPALASPALDPGQPNKKDTVTPTQVATATQTPTATTAPTATLAPTTTAAPTVTTAPTPTWTPAPTGTAPVAATPTSTFAAASTTATASATTTTSGTGAVEVLSIAIADACTNTPAISGTITLAGSYSGTITLISSYHLPSSSDFYPTGGTVTLTLSNETRKDFTVPVNLVSGANSYRVEIQASVPAVLGQTKSDSVNCVPTTLTVTPAATPTVTPAPTATPTVTPTPTVPPTATTPPQTGVIIVDGQFGDWTGRENLSDPAGDGCLGGDIHYFYWGSNPNDNALYLMIERYADSATATGEEAIYTTFIDTDNDGNYAGSEDRVVITTYDPRNNNSRVVVTIASASGKLISSYSGDWGQSTREGSLKVEFKLPFDDLAIIARQTIRVFTVSQCGDRVPNSGDVQMSPIPLLDYPLLAVVVLGTTFLAWRSKGRYTWRT